MTKIYHLALVTDWQTTVENKATYYPPTYDADGFTHGTSEAYRLIEVANHFYTDSIGDWCCLEMTEDTLSIQGVEVRFEPAASVGNKSGEIACSEQILFPHLYGGIHPNAVTATYPVIRDEAGNFCPSSLIMGDPRAANEKLYTLVTQGRSFSTPSLNGFSRCGLRVPEVRAVQAATGKRNTRVQTSA